MLRGPSFLKGPCFLKGVCVYGVDFLISVPEVSTSSKEAPRKLASRRRLKSVVDPFESVHVFHAAQPADASWPEGRLPCKH